VTRTLQIAVVPGILAVQLALLTFRIGEDFQRKHEDNNALHATFARAHLQLGIATTRGHNYFFNPATGLGGHYANHPPGAGLLLAAVYGATGIDSPAMTRGTAIAIHMLGTWLFYQLARRVLHGRAAAAVALAAYAVLPESSFFGRMVNHEVLVLPAALLLVRAYWELIRGGWPMPRAVTAMLAAAAAATIAGWAGFFVIAACLAHGALELTRGNRRARIAVLTLAAAGALPGVVVAASLVGLPGVDASHFGNLAAARMTGQSGDTVLQSLARVLEIHWRYFGLTAAIALGYAAWHSLRQAFRHDPDPALDIVLIFLTAGAAYVLVFLPNAARHDYWQFLLLPAAALSLPLLARAVRVTLTARGRPVAARVLLAVMAVEMTATAVATLSRRYSKGEAYAIEKVSEIRSHFL
jgi:hypothetical protein